MIVSVQQNDALIDESRKYTILVSWATFANVD